MKKANPILALVMLAIGAGCHTSHHEENSTATVPAPAQQPAYTVELIPNPQLTPTSREGDKSSAVYSQNIVAVYQNSNGVAGGLTNPPPNGQQPGAQR